jgi:hypothetical protein
MEPTWFAMIVTGAAAIVAAIVGGVVGAKRGVAAADDKLDRERVELISTLSSRVAILEKERTEDRKTIADLTKRVHDLECDLATERSITARIAPPKGEPA